MTPDEPLVDRIQKVGIGQLAVLKGRGILVAYGLGSCIALFIYDSLAKVGGLAHIMLSGAAPENLNFSKTKYAENAFQELLSLMKNNGGDLRRVAAVLVGGASMFRDPTDDHHETVGKKNIEGVRQILKRNNIRILAEEVGGDYGRTVEAHITDGRVLVKSYTHGVRELKWMK